MEVVAVHLSGAAWKDTQSGEEDKSPLASKGLMASVALSCKGLLWKYGVA